MNQAEWRKGICLWADSCLPHCLATDFWFLAPKAVTKPKSWKTSFGMILWQRNYSLSTCFRMHWVPLEHIKSNFSGDASCIISVWLSHMSQLFNFKQPLCCRLQVLRTTTKQKGVSIKKWKQQRIRSIDKSENARSSFNWSNQLNPNPNPTQGRLDALRGIKERGEIKFRTKTGQAYEKRQVWNSSTVCIFVSLYVGYVNLVSLMLLIPVWCNAFIKYLLKESCMGI